jgi:hypothetical protein
MIKLPLEKLTAYRAKTYRLLPGQQLTSMDEAATFIKQRGFIFFWPIKGVELPSLWTAVAGPRPVADAHDDPGHVTWGWKDNSLGKKIWYYGKIVRKKATMIDLEVVPYFYALSENYGDPEDDVLIQYHEGHLTQEAKAIFDVILEEGPMDTVAIRRVTRMTHKESNSRFDRAITQLQSDFKILPIGISDAGGWRYAFIYEMVHRYYPGILENAKKIKEKEAYDKLTWYYLQSVGATRLQDVTRIFRWNKSDTEQAIRNLVDEGILIGGLTHTETPGEWFALKSIF